MLKKCVCHVGLTDHTVLVFHPSSPVSCLLVLLMSPLIPHFYYLSVSGQWYSALLLFQPQSSPLFTVIFIWLISSESSHYLPQTIVLHALTFLLLTTLLLSIILNIFSSAVSLLPTGTQSSEVAATVSLDWAPLSTIILKCSTSSESDFVTRPHWCYCNSQNKMPFVLTVTIQH